MISVEKLKSTIRCIHGFWYRGKFLEDPVEAIKLHSHMEDLFNFAGITETLCENNPDLMSPDEFAKQMGLESNGET
jgi:hypothetical protein